MKSTVSPDKKLANVVGGKSARACDNCVKKRARWYCAADDAFLCQSCDSSVHSANPLARRHERVRLKTAGFEDQTRESQPKTRPSKISVPTWHRGVTKKPRTPRGKKHAKADSDGESKINNPLHLVPEISSDHSQYENEEQLLYRVPIFDPFVAELCSSANPNESNNDMQSFGHEKKVVSNDFNQEMSHLHNFLPSEMDLAEFAADVESLLGKGLEDESFDMESLGLLDSKECSFGTERVKNEDDEEIGEVQETEFELIDMGRETFELNFDYDCEEEEEDVKAEIREPAGVMLNNDLGSSSRVDDSKRNMLLRLDYKGVLSAWDDHKSPWTTGERPELDDSGDCWPACMGTCGRVHIYGDMGLMGGHASVMADGGREARVSRYREKRRTRLFSKKIRYEVRKLNAEKRPRMKGRFVKRTNLVAPGLPMLKN